MRLRRPLPAVQGDTLHIVGVGDNRIGKGQINDGKTSMPKRGVIIVIKTEAIPPAMCQRT